MNPFTARWLRYSEVVVNLTSTSCSAITTSVQKAEIITSCSLFPGPAHTPKYLLGALKSLGVNPPRGSSRNELLELLSNVSPREEFLGAIQSCRREFIDS